MKLLAIDSSGLVAGVAVMVDDILVGEYTIHNKKTHSQTLLPMVADMLSMADIDKNELDAVAVACGPGSFTGLRIGAATAKGLAQALGIPVIPVSTLCGLAYNLAHREEVVCPLMDARRSQAYYGLYDVSGEIPKALVPEAAEAVESVIGQAKSLDRPVIFLGDGVPVFRDRLSEAMGERALFSKSVDRYQRAASVAALGVKYYEQGRGVPAESFVPSYLRESSARKLGEK